MSQINLQSLKITDGELDYPTKMDSLIDTLQTSYNNLDATAAASAAAVAAYTDGPVNAVHAMTEAEFRKRQEKNKRDYPASGFLEWGKHDNTTTNVNQGLVISATSGWQNVFRLGSATNLTGESKSNHPVIICNGVDLTLNLIRSSAEENDIYLPPAPDGSETFNEATYTYTDHGTAAAAFSYLDLVTNGVYATDSGWTKGTGWSIASGKATKAAGVASNLSQTVAARYGEAVVSFSVKVTAGSLYASWANDSGSTITASGTYQEILTPTQVGDLVFVADSSFAGDIYDVSIKLVHEEVITSRQDIVFLECWEELLTTNDVWYPFGNTQYGGTTHQIDHSSESLALVNTAVTASYSRFGDWDSSPTPGYGLKWSSASDAAKQLALSDPTGNTFINNDGDLVQLRYRIRSVKGRGNKWANTDPDVSHMYYLSDNYVKPQGQYTSITADIASSSANGTGYFYYNQYGNSETRFTVGQWTGVSVSSGRDTSLAYEGACFAVPIALVQRRNSLGYHPNYNPEGCAWLRTSAAASGATNWYTSTVYEHTNKESVFLNPTTNASYLGSITSGNSGRSDGKYYDAIYADDIKDLRASARPVNDLQRLMNKEFDKALYNDDFRGWEATPETRFFSTTVKSSTYADSKTWLALEDDVKPWPVVDTNDSLISMGADRYATPIGFLVHSGTLYFIHHAGDVSGDSNIFVSNSSRDRNVDLTSTFTAGQEITGGVIYRDKEADTHIRNAHSAAQFHNCDIFGDLDNYPRIWTGKIDHQSTDASASMSVGHVVEAVDGSTVGGTDHHVYLNLTVTGTTNLTTQDYSNTTNYRDLGTVSEFKNHARLAGTPNPITDDGVSQVPDGANDNFKLSRKAIANPSLYLRSTDNGVTWSSFSPTYTSSNNNITLTNEPAANIVMVYYATYANAFTPADQAPVLAYGEVWGGVSNDSVHGSHLCKNLTGYTPVGTAAGGVKRGFVVENYLIDASTKGFVETTDYNPQHNNIDLGRSESVGVKMFPYIRVLNNRLYLNIIFKQLLFNNSNDNWVDSGSGTAPDASTSYTQGKLYKCNVAGAALEGRILQFVGSSASIAHTWGNMDQLPGSNEVINTSTAVIDNNWLVWAGDPWGDDNEFLVIDDVATTTDNNGSRVVVGNYRAELPYYYRDDE